MAIEAKVHRADRTSLTLGGQTSRCLPRENLVDRSGASGKKEKSSLKKLLRRGSRN